MKLYIQVGMGFSTTDERKAKTWKSNGLDVVVIDAEAYVPPAPKPERWTVVGEVGDALATGGSFDFCNTSSGLGISYPNKTEAERLKDALEAGGMTDLRVVKIEESE